MDRTSGTNYATSGGKRYFANQNLGAGIPGTEIEQVWTNGVQEELAGIIEGTGIALDVSSNLQALRAIKRLAGANSSAVLTANTTLTPDDAGLVIVNATAGNMVLTMPAGTSANGTPMAFTIVRIDGVPTHTVTIALQGGDGLVVPGPLTVTSGQVVRAIALGGTAWVTAIANSPSSLGSSGWEISASGVIRQWATAPTTTGNGDVIAFPIAFPNAVDNIVITEQNASGWGSPPQPTLFGWAHKTNADFYLYGLRFLSGGAATYQSGLGCNYVATGR